MIGALAAVDRAWRRQRYTHPRSEELARARASVLEALRSRVGRMLSRQEIRQLSAVASKRDLTLTLNQLEKSGLIVVDREERPVLYGLLPGDAP